MRLTCGANTVDFYDWWRGRDSTFEVEQAQNTEGSEPRPLLRHGRLLGDTHVGI